MIFLIVKLLWWEKVKFFASYFCIINGKLITASDYSKLTSNTLDVKMIQKKLVNKSDLNEKIKTLTTTDK